MEEKQLSLKERLEKLDPMEDFIFFKYMGEGGNEIQQKTFLKALGIDIKGKIRSMNPKIPRDTEENKTSILDCRLRTSCRKAIDIEMQKSETSDFEEKLISYLSKMISTSLLKGKKYTVMNKAILVVICNFDFLNSENFHNIHSLKNIAPEINELISEKIEIHTIEIEKFRNFKKYLCKEDIYSNKLYQYLIFIDKETSHKERMEIVNMGDEGLIDSMKKIEEALQNPDELDDFLTIKIKERHTEHMMREKEENGKIKMAKKLKKEGIPIGTIAKTSGLSVSTIKKL